MLSRISIDIKVLKDLRCPLDDKHREGQALALRLSRPSPFTVGRGPVPRHRSGTPTIAGDRPPRYGEKTSFVLFRSVRTCMSIAVETRRALRSFRSLIVFEMRRVFLLRS